jgi:hypothetical protein
VVNARNNSEVEGRRPPYHINGRQYVCIERIKIILGRDKEEEEEEEEEEEGGLDKLQLDGTGATMRGWQIARVTRCRYSRRRSTR